VNHVTWSCELRFHGESYGWETLVLRDGELFSARVRSSPKRQPCSGPRNYGRAPKRASLRSSSAPFALGVY